MYAAAVSGTNRSRDCVEFDARNNNTVPPPVSTIKTARTNAVTRARLARDAG